MAGFSVRRVYSDAHSQSAEKVLALQEAEGTVHALQDSNGDLEGFFACNADSPLDAPSGKLSILVDETSMLDMSLAGALLDAIPTNMPVQLVLVGEPLLPSWLT